MSLHSSFFPLFGWVCMYRRKWACEAVGGEGGYRRKRKGYLAGLKGFLRHRFSYTKGPAGTGAGVTSKGKHRVRSRTIGNQKKLTLSFFSSHIFLITPEEGIKKLHSDRNDKYDLFSSV